MTLDDIKYVTFRKSTIGGYRTEDVDTFIDDVQDSFKELLDRNEELEKKLSKVLEKVAAYKEDEDAFKQAFLKAQKLSEISIKDAKIQANSIIEDSKAEAEKILKESKEKVLVTSKQFDELKKEISIFKKKIIDLYKEHLKLLDSLPAVKLNNQTINIENKTKEVVKNPEKAYITTKKNEEVLQKLDLKLDEIKEESDVYKNSNFENKNDKPFLKFGENYKISADTDSDGKSTINIFGEL